MHLEIQYSTRCSMAYPKPSSTHPRVLGLGYALSVVIRRNKGRTEICKLNGVPSVLLRYLWGKLGV